MNKERNPFFVTSLIAGAFFMENLDGTIIATALPQMARSFHTGAVYLNLGMTAYLITLAVFIPVSGWVADRFGCPHRLRLRHLPLHLRISPLRLLPNPHPVHPPPHPARHRRSHDGPCRKTGSLAQYTERPAHPGHRLHHLAGTCRAGRRARPLAASSPPTSPGDGSSISTCPSASSRWA